MMQHSNFQRAYKTRAERQLQQRIHAIVGLLKGKVDAFGMISAREAAGILVTLERQAYRRGRDSAHSLEMYRRQRGAA